MKTSEQIRAGTVAIVGAGPGGATLGRLLQMRGFNVKVFERDASATARPQGGSLDLRPDSGQRAIDAAGLGDEFARFSRDEAKAFKMIDSQGNEMPGMGEETHEDAGPEIDRKDLRQLLIDSLAPGPSPGAILSKRFIPKRTEGGGWSSRTRRLSLPISWWAPTASAPRSAAA